MKTRVLLAGLLIGWGWAGQARAGLVACVGDSITYGAGIVNRTTDSYPAQLQRILRQYDPTWEVRNFGVSGATLLRKGDLPYVLQSAYNQARACNPDIVIIKLGTNDSKPQNWAFQAEFVPDYERLIDSFRILPSQPQVWLCKPVPAFRENFAIRPEVIRDEILPLVEQIGQEMNAPVIDLFTALSDATALFPDGIHPNAEGAGLMAQTIAPFLLGVRFLPDFNGDGVLNLRDFARLALLWHGNDPALDVAPPPGGDGLLDLRDLAGLSRYWMTFPGVIAYWRLDETQGQVAADKFGRFDGIAYGSPVWRPGGGRVGGALEFDGVDDYIAVGNVLNPADGPFTVFTWVKGGRPGAVILSQASETGSGEAWLSIDASTGGLMTNLTDGSRITVPLVSEAIITDGFWHHVRLIWDGSHRYLYVDGREVAADTRTLSTTLKFSGAHFYMGAGNALQPATFWPGLLDDIRIYNRAVKP
jgi:acyl-CoA thioesterase-1